MMLIYRKYFYLMLPLKNFQIAKEEHTAVEEPQPSTSIEFEETGVVMGETTASETIVSVI